MFIHYCFWKVDNVHPWGRDPGVQQSVLGGWTSKATDVSHFTSFYVRIQRGLVCFQCSSLFLYTVIYCIYCTFVLNMKFNYHPQFGDDALQLLQVTFQSQLKPMKLKPQRHTAAMWIHCQKQAKLFARRLGVFEDFGITWRIHISFVLTL